MPDKILRLQFSNSYFSTKVKEQRFFTLVKSLKKSQILGYFEIHLIKNSLIYPLQSVVSRMFNENLKGQSISAKTFFLLFYPV